VPARNAILNADNEVLVSAASAMEIAIKFRIGKLPHVAQFVDEFKDALSAEGFQSLDVKLEHALWGGSMPFAHKDPFDRLLIAQALSEELTLVSNERLFDETGVSRLW
jgi:PIN domain nuclease of toxin-antitoxin system